MMISPQGYKEQHKDKTLKELIKERNKLLDSLRAYEENTLNDVPSSDGEMFVKPSPETVYFWSNHYLKEVTDLIIEKSKNRGE